MRLRLTMLGVIALMLLGAAAVHCQSFSSGPSITVYADPT